MARKNYPMTIDELISEAIKAKNKYGGDRFVLLSNDEEGNGYHECYFTFVKAEDFINSYMIPKDLDIKNCVLLG